MNVNTKAMLLEALGKGSAVYDWGAIMALGRDTVNALLQAKFLERLSQTDFIQPITETYFVDESRTERVAFDELVFGPPSLSFEHASGHSARVRVHMELIAGRCTSWSMFPGEPHYLRRSHQLAPGLGNQLEFMVDLIVMPAEGAASRQLQLALDLRNATAPTCALGQGSAERMGQFMLEQLLSRPAFAQPFYFMTIAPIGSEALTAIDVTLISQRAPDGAGTGSVPEADGAVLLFMQLAGSGNAGFIPGAMPYLLPRKVDSIAENTGAALLIGRLRAQIRAEPARSLLPQLVMPGGATIAIDDEHQPHDLICFGELEASASMAWLSPGISSIAAGESVAFSSNGARVYDWQARGVNSPRSAGSISEQGSYHARSIEASGSAQRVTVVTAKASQAADAQLRAALVIESAEPLTVSPRVVTWFRGYADVALRASGSSALTWKLLGERMGDIRPDPEDPRRATFTPTPQNTPFVRLQRIEVSDGNKTGHATIVLFGVGPNLQVEPFPPPRLSPGASQQFNLTNGEQAVWEVFGPGAIDSATGMYTAPAQTNEEVSVVVARAERFAGAVVVEHHTPAPAAAMAQEERWKTLKEFSLKRNNQARNQVFANGFQQVGVDIVIATHSFKDSNGEEVWDPVSDLELSTLVLTDEINNPVPYLTGDELGIPEGSEHTWMVSKRRHAMFDYYPTGQTAEAEPLSSEADGKRTVTVYVHSREAEIANFRAMFQDHNRGWHSSVDDDDVKGEIQLEGVQLPLKSLDYFKWPEQGKRVANQGGEDYEGDRYNYWHSTTDYWELSGNGISFADVVFDSMSMVMWESEQLDETFASYTGLAFKPRRPEEATEIPPGVNYQAELQLLAQEDSVNYSELDYAFKGQEEVTAGAVLVTLDRTSKLPFWDDHGTTKYREVLNSSVKFTVTDNYGNKHPLRLLFSGLVDARNYLELKLQ
ncbi:hypothetical protein C6A77_13635 [Pseudomonas sp. AFG_SD02_1510_Pfu_092]|uniref:hypothetical protein n=1 Tax=Pseudomonas sp. AFG_SD02_1510_Pfu_092 TaxID=2259497 RepID=UPI000DEF1F44|nr:hypothetical protein [Pseudomonas sp. AFG_SD02_1510_Pfu_092]RCL25638.1 hypothetical protein C6A77_13635 [Pseudomonas sp. AFG_SD02_1510_Pfu_092]